MLFGKEGFLKWNIGKYLVGYEITEKKVQISYLQVGKDTPETVSTTVGIEDYDIPLALFKAYGESQWYFGKEAIERAETVGEGVFLENLLDLATKEELIPVENESYNGVALLALFIRRSFSYLPFFSKADSIGGITFVLPELTEERIQSMRQALDILKLQNMEVRFIGKQESFYHYNMHTDPVLWKDRVYLYEMQGNQLSSLCMEQNRRTKPIVITVQSKEYPPFVGEMALDDRTKEWWDQEFFKLAKTDLEEKEASTIYLIGDGFAGNWYSQSLQYLCNNRRVFAGNNLYSRGACFFLQDLSDTDKQRTTVFLGEDKVLANVGVEVSAKGEPSYLSLIEGGQSWYHCSGSFHLILWESNRLVIKITPLDGKDVREVAMVLRGLPAEENRGCRIHLQVKMKNRREMTITVEDLGFGDYFPSTNQVFTENFELYSS
ncbi:MAG: DUF5716 family protein [Lachnospiraceae bacterium]|nr:DUF5716 family protein [Lachnospiraceae bacterium]